MEKKTISKLGLVAVAVISSMPSGYRRAGFALENGENEITADNCTLDQLETLEKDSRLAVKRIEASEGSQSASSSNGSVDFTVEQVKALDVDEAPEEIRPFVFAIVEDGLIAKPNCKDLVVEAQLDGEEELKKLTPSSQQRDDAWAWVLEKLKA